MLSDDLEKGLVMVNRMIRGDDEQLERLSEVVPPEANEAVENEAVENEAVENEAAEDE